MDQEIFAGVGNIIKNEVLLLLKLHPESNVENLKPRAVGKLVDKTRTYSFQFYHWKKAFILKKNWKIFRKRKCPACGAEMIKEKKGELKRVSFYCAECSSR